jgi:hypothetical protein
MMASAKKSVLVLALGTIAVLSSNAAFATITYVTDATTTSSIPGLTGYATTGAMMNGMSVQAVFSGGVNQTLSWAATGAASGGVTGSGWGLSLNGDSFGGNWLFTIDANAGLGQLLSLVLNGNPGYTVFDRNWSPYPGTPDSADGMDFNFVSGFTGDATVTYSDEVYVGANAPVGDLWHMLTVDFGAGGPRAGFAFVQDTDNDARYAAPEPTSLAIVGLGLAALIGARRFKSV